MKYAMLMALFSFFMIPSAWAQKGDVEDFYRPVKATDLTAVLPPRVDADRNFEDSDADFFAFEGSGCPNEISIGSVDGETPVFGGVDIDVIIENDIIINCGGL